MHTFLIKCRGTCSARGIKALVEQIHVWGGHVLLVTDGGRSLIIHIKDRFRDEIQARQEVALIGGIQIQPRRVRRIRVDESGNHLATDVIIQGENHG